MTEPVHYLDFSSDGPAREYVIFGNAAACVIPLNMIGIDLSERHGLVIFSEQFSRGKNATVVIASLVDDLSSNTGKRVSLNMDQPRTPDEAEFLTSQLILATQYANGVRNGTIVSPVTRTDNCYQEPGVLCCPNCKYRVNDPEDYFEYDETPVSVTCENCGETFSATSHTTFTYTVND